MDITRYILPAWNHVRGTCGNDFKDYLIAHRNGDRGLFFSYPMNPGNDATRHCWGLWRIRSGYLTLDYDGMKEDMAHVYRDPMFPDGMRWCPSDVQYEYPYTYPGREVADLPSTCVLSNWRGWNPTVIVHDAGYQDLCGTNHHRIKIDYIQPSFTEYYWFAWDMGLVGYAGPTWSGGWAYCKGDDGFLATCSARW